MIIGLHDSDGTGFPNYALMKISAWHKVQGDIVEWWNPMLTYDRVYSSKVFTFTPENPYLPPDTIKGGTGYGIYTTLPDEIDRMFPDYSIYPKIDYAIGFLTRGCIRGASFHVKRGKSGHIVRGERSSDRTATKLFLWITTFFPANMELTKCEKWQM